MIVVRRIALVSVGQVLIICGCVIVVISASQRILIARATRARITPARGVGTRAMVCSFTPLAVLASVKSVLMSIPSAPRVTRTVGAMCARTSGVSETISIQLRRRRSLGVSKLYIGSQSA